MRPSSEVVEARGLLWTTRNVLILAATILVGGTIATAITMGSGALLLVLSPMLLVFSPILVPAVIIFTVVAGGAVTFAGGFVLFAGAISAWIYIYVTGGRPYGSAQADVLSSRSRELVSQAKQQAYQLLSSAQEATSQARAKVNETARNSYGYLQAKIPPGASSQGIQSRRQGSSALQT